MEIASSASGNILRAKKSSLWTELKSHGYKQTLKAFVVEFLQRILGVIPPMYKFWWLSVNKRAQEDQKVKK